MKEERRTANRVQRILVFVRDLGWSWKRRCGPPPLLLFFSKSPQREQSLGGSCINNNRNSNKIKQNKNYRDQQRNSMRYMMTQSLYKPQPKKARKRLHRYFRTCTYSVIPLACPSYKSRICLILGDQNNLNSTPMFPSEFTPQSFLTQSPSLPKCPTLSSTPI